MCQYLLLILVNPEESFTPRPKRLGSAPPNGSSLAVGAMHAETGEHHP